MRDDGRARRAVVDQLAQRTDDAAIAMLLEMYAAETAWSIHKRIRVALSRKCRMQHNIVFAAALAGRSDDERLLLLEALTTAKSPAVRDLWVEYFVRHPAAGYRACAAYGLRRLADPLADSYLFELARDREAGPRCAAVEAFGARRSDGMLSAVIDALWDVDREVEWTAHWQVRKFERHGWDALVAAICARGASYGAVQAVSWYVAISRSVPHFREALADPAPGVRLGALECLNGWTHVQSDELSDAIGRAAHDPDVAVRTRAVLALRWFASTPVSRLALEAAANDPDPGVRAMASDSSARRFSRLA